MAQQKWNLGDIRPPERERSVRRRRTDVAPARKTVQPVADTSDAAPPQRRRKRTAHRTGNGRRALFFGVVIVCLIALGFLTTLLLRRAEIITYPKFRDITVQASFTAYQEPALDQLGYELLTLEETGERTVTASGSEEVEERATGTITVYNRYSTSPQRLIKNTRFESPDGLIFRIPDSVVVPGYTTDSAGEKVPGTLTTEVFADATGEAYNIEPARFTIPGLEGTEQFETMYAESTESMRGGFIGTRLVVDESQLDEAQRAIHAELEERLRARLASERPAGFELYENSVQIRFESLPSVEAGGGQATVRERGVLEAPLFASGELASYLAQNTIPGYEDEPVRLEGAQSLVFSYASTSAAVLGTAPHVDFDLYGNTRIVWDYDEAALITDVAGAEKTAVPAIIAKYPAIERIETVIKPFWKQSFPDNPSKIRVTEVLTEEG